MSILRRSEALVATVLAASTMAVVARADEDSLAPYRDRFRQGMEKYKAGAMAEAIRIWSAIYEEIGPQRGYRLSFDLARAYEANVETSRAAERYQSFLDEVAVRRRAGETLDAIVEREATEAESRLDQLNATNGRIRVVSGGRTVLAQVDGADPRLGSFISYVAPGDHVVVFGPGSPDQDRRDVSVKAGELAVVNAPAAPETPQPVTPPVPAKVEPPRVIRIETEHPFSPLVIYVSAGVTVASLVVPALTYNHAFTLLNQYDNASTAQKESLSAGYYNARTTAYATYAIPVTLAAVTGTLVTLYFAGQKQHEVTVGAGLQPGGGSAFLRASF